MFHSILSSSSVCSAFFGSVASRPTPGAESETQRTQIIDDWELIEDPIDGLHRIVEALHEEPTRQGRRLALRRNKAARGWGVSPTGEDTFYGKQCCAEAVRTRTTQGLVRQNWNLSLKHLFDAVLCPLCLSEGPADSTCNCAAKAGVKAVKRRRNDTLTCPACLSAYKRLQVQVPI